MYPLSKPAFYGIGVIVGGTGWVYDPFRPFPFLDLPAEIRNKIYDFVVPSCRVLITGNHPQKEIAHYKKIHQSRRAPKTPYRLCSALLCNTDPQDLAAAVALLKACRTFNNELVSVLYSKTTFCFTSIKHINKLLRIIPQHGKKALSSIKITYSAYGEPQWTKDEFWKRKSDWKWAVVCTRLAKELPALRDVVLDLRVADWPIQLTSTAPCFIPLDILKGPGLERVRVYLSHYRFHPHRCGSVARALEDMMMTPEGRELRDLEEAVEAVRQMQEEEARKAQLPPLRAKKVLVIKAAPSAAEAESQPAQKQAAAGPAASKPKLVYRTKGLEGWSRISLDAVGVSWCGPPRSIGLTSVPGMQ